MTTLNVTLSTILPPNLELVQIADPGTGTVRVTGAAGSVEPNRRVRVTNLRTGASVLVDADAQGAFFAEIEGLPTDELQIRAENASGVTSAPRVATVPGQALPPSPQSVATPLASTGITPFADSIAFLYSASNPIQSGVAPGTIQAERASVLRGSVTTRAGQPIANVVVSVKDHSEYGQTRTRIDGRFDLAVNGGSTLTIDYQRTGYLPVQRHVTPAQKDYALTDNVVMIPPDASATVIELNAATLQAHQSSVTTDLDGDRRVTVMVPAGTTATLTLPDGSTQPLTASMRVRATEYTVGVTGAEAMPAPLPPTSAYTYAVELSVDEAIAAGARRLDFNQPLPIYLENFLNFPIGAQVPVGYYDSGASAWIASENGRVIRIIGIAGGLAELDVDGSNEAAGSTALAALGLSNAERQRLATLYSVGAAFWRFRVTHFSPWDCNFPFDLAPDANPPPDFNPDQSPDDLDSDETPECEGCTIEAHTQVLGESIRITGTPYTINYRSDRAGGGGFAFPVTGATLAPSLATVDVRVSVAGRDILSTSTGQYSPARLVPSQNHIQAADWDGRDVYGRPMLLEIGRASCRERV